MDLQRPLQISANFYVDKTCIHTCLCCYNRFVIIERILHHSKPTILIFRTEYEYFFLFVVINQHFNSSQSHILDYHLEIICNFYLFTGYGRLAPGTTESFMPEGLEDVNFFEDE